MTIKDIAREAGYSVGTVSRVLNRTGNVSAKAEKRILEVVEKYHFELNSNAQNLKKQSKDGIAIVVKSAQNMIFLDFVQRLEGIIKRNDFVCMVYYLKDDDNEVKEAIKICAERRPKGILFLGIDPEYFRQRFASIKVPCVLVTSSGVEFQEENLSSVSTDDEMAAAFAMEYLMERGHRAIGILGGAADDSLAFEARYKGCEKGFSKYGVAYNPELQCETAKLSMAAGYEGMQNLLKRFPEMTAVFVMADIMAIGAIRAIKDAGLRVPEDISVLGFDGIDFGNYTVPRLTTIRQDNEKIVAKSMEILLRNIEGPLETMHELEPFSLVERESVCECLCTEKCAQIP